MNHSSEVKSHSSDLSWLKNDDPEIYHLLGALEGDLDALRWLKLRGDGLFLFAEALTGAKEAVETLQEQPAEKLGDLFDTIAHCDVDDWLNENHPELHRLFSFVRGDGEALRGLKHKRVTLKRVAEIVRDKYCRVRPDEADGMTSGDANSAASDGTAADVGCLIGEMHLHNREYHKAIEAFSRALAHDPTPDAFTGRARAYRALCTRDERAAADLRGRTVS